MDRRAHAGDPQSSQLGEMVRASRQSQLAVTNQPLRPQGHTMITERHKQAALAECDLTVRALGALRKQPIAQAYDKLIRDARRFGGGGNYARARIDGMPRSKSYGSRAPRS